MRNGPIDRRQFLLATGGTLLSAGVGALLLRLSPHVFAQGLPGSPSFKGAAGKSIQGPVNLSAGIVVLRAQHNGTANFTVTLFVPNPAETPQQSADDASGTDSSLVYDEVGSFKGATAAMAGTTGAHYLAVTASGAFEISVEQPTPEKVQTVQQTTFSGKGKDVSPYFTLPSGISTLSVQTAAKDFRGWLYHLDDLGGEPVQSGVNVYDGRFFDFTFPGNQTSYPVNLPDAGPYLLSTDNLGPADTWAFAFQ